MSASPDDEFYIGYMISDVGRLMRTVFERRIRQFGLTRAQWIVITRTYRRPGLNQSEIADLLEVEKASAGRLIDRMEVNGWIERRADKSDRRMNRLFLTAKARRLHSQIWPIAEQTVDDALADLPVAERAALQRALLKMKGRLVALLAEDPALTSARRRASFRRLEISEPRS